MHRKNGSVASAILVLQTDTPVKHLFVGLLTLIATTSVWAQYEGQPLFMQYVSAEGKPSPKFFAEKRRLVYPLWKERFPFIDLMTYADTVLAQGFLVDTVSVVLDGPLASYYSNGQLKGIARYFNGKKDGQWVDFYETGDTSRIRLYESDSALTNVCFERDHSIIHTGFDCGEKEPFPLNMNEIWKRIRYPADLRNSGKEGKVILRLLVNAEGQVVKHIVVRQPDAKFTQEVVSHVYELRFKPAMYHSEPIKIWVTIPFDFKMQ